MGPTQPPTQAPQADPEHMKCAAHKTCTVFQSKRSFPVVDGRPVLLRTNLFRGMNLPPHQERMSRAFPNQSVKARQGARYEGHDRMLHRTVCAARPQSWDPTTPRPHGPQCQATPGFSSKGKVRGHAAQR